jgi:serine phosphatase RsbU (regulator of sigma subunit)
MIKEKVKLKVVAKDLQILFVEDEKLVRIEIEEILSRIFKSVDLASNGKDGLKQYTKNKYDIVISDIKMPVMNGVEFVRHIKKINPEQKIIIISAHDDSDYLINLIDIGIDNYILKPLKVGYFLKILYEISKSIIQGKMLFRYRKNLEKALTQKSKLLEELKVEIEERKKAEQQVQLYCNKMEEDLKRAKLIQDALLPNEIPKFEKIKIDYRYKPLKVVGGDYFSFTKLPDGGLGVFIGDVQGHGVSAALFLALVKSVTDNISKIYRMNPKGYIKNLHLALSKITPSFYFTALYGVFTSEENGSGIRFTFSSAGHPYPILYDSKMNKIDYLEITGSSLGIFDDINEVTIQEKIINLHKNDRIYIYSDGISESLNGMNNKLNSRVLTKILSKQNSNNLSHTLNILMDKINHSNSVSKPKDDMVIIGFEII